MEATTEALPIRYNRLLLFPASWLVFYLIGRAFFENNLGSFHSTYLRKWAIVCKALFLLTFIMSCTLFELIIFEILDLLHTTLRQFVWTSTLGILSLLLNILIPAVFAYSVGIHAEMSSKAAAVICIVTTIIFQCVMWIIGVCILPNSNNDDYSSTTGKDSSSDHSDNTLVQFLYNIVVVDVQKSVSHIAFVGVSTAAMIAGFAAVSFPMEHIAVHKMSVDLTLLRAKERLLSGLLAATALEKKRLHVAKLEENRLIITSTIINSNSNGGGGIKALSVDSFDNSYSYDDANVGSSEGMSNNNHNNSSNNCIFCKLKSFYMSLMICFLSFLSTVPFMKSNRMFKYLHRIVFRGSNRVGSPSSSPSNSEYSHVLIKEIPKLSPTRRQITLMEMDIKRLSDMSLDQFNELLFLRQLYDQSQRALTVTGHVLRASAWALTLVGIWKLSSGILHVAGYFMFVKKGGSGGAIRLLADTVDYALLADANADIATNEQHPGRFGSAPISLHAMITNFFRYILTHLRLPFNLHMWSPLLSLCLVVVLFLMQIRGFFVVTTQLAKLGFISTSTELYALLLAQIAGTYFVAGVVLLRAELPLRYRKGITVALGEDLPLNFYFWLFDAVFIISSILSIVLLYNEYYSKLKTYVSFNSQNSYSSNSLQKLYRKESSDGTTLMGDEMGMNALGAVDHSKCVFCSWKEKGRRGNDNV